MIILKEKDDIIYGTGKDRIQSFCLDVDGCIMYDIWQSC